ncbi:hypothetical protein CGRAC_0896 [Campylobacter gracilis]|nr:hypothetical protein CGRAC_0896 [Campylobacter gracilis]
MHKVNGILPQQLWRNNFNAGAQFINLLRKQAELWRDGFNIASGAIWRSKGLPREK